MRDFLLAAVLALVFASPAISTPSAVAGKRVDADSASQAMEILRGAVAAWHFADNQSIDGRSPLSTVGKVALGVPLTGSDRAASLARGGDGFAARFDKGYLDAGQGGQDCLQLKGDQFTVLFRLRLDANMESGDIFAKHGSHALTTFNLFFNQGRLGFEFGLAERPGLGMRIQATVESLPPGNWMDLIARYDGGRLDFYANGKLIDSKVVSGDLRINTLPLLIGRALRGQLVDHAALWQRALSNDEIDLLSGRPGPSVASAQPDAVSGADRVIGDFSGSDYGSWVATGTAFGSAPKAGAANSAQAEPNAYGTLTSPEFVIDRPYLNFRLGGEEYGTDMRLLVDGRTVQTAKGKTPGELHPWSWDVRRFIGRSAKIELRDYRESRARSNAYVMAADVRLSSTSSLVSLENRLTLDGPFLNIPAAFDGREASFVMEIDGKPFRSGTYIAPEPGQDYYWLAFDLRDYLGKSVHLRVDKAPVGSPALSLASVGDRPRESGASLYAERLRPQFHFSARTGWLNDPNGMVYFDGEYHLFFQHNALGNVIGNQSWGHAVSPDLFSWEELPVVMEPYSFSCGRSFSGSAIVDLQNRAGFGQNALIAAYTDFGWNRTKEHAEVLAYSLDRGRSFTYPAAINPVYRHPESGRDPKVVWWPFADKAQTDPDGHWVMINFSRQDGENGARILISNDLKNWVQTDLVPDHYECMEIYELPVRDAHGVPTGVVKTVIHGGNGTYNIGSFDGRRFRPDDAEKHQTLMQPGFAFQRFNQDPEGRIVIMGWIRRHTNWQDMPFSQMMSLPLEITLCETPEGPRMRANPTREFGALLRDVVKWENVNLSSGTPLVLPSKGQQFDLEVTFRPQDGSPVSIEFGADHLEWKDGLINGRYPVPLDAEGNVVVRVVVDRPLIELFGNHGAIYQPIARREQGRDVVPTIRGAALIVSLRLSEVASTMSARVR